jgi:CRISPR/Cas system-associated exonuclease Cas4 (RecB family)
MIEFLMPQHVSHSAMNNYIRCGKAYELGKLGVTEAPAWWLIGGSAVHKATEWLDKGEWDEAPEMAFYQAFNDEIFDAVDREPDQELWRKAGYGARAQGHDHWMKQGPRYVKQWAERYAPKWWDVELDVSTTLPSGIKIRAYIDRVAFDGDHKVYEIVDLKTGSTRPDSDQQLGIYKVLFEHYLAWNGYDMERGTLAYNYMFKDDEFYEMDVSNWTLETVDEMAQEWYRGLESGVFLPNRGKQCGSCGVSSGCFLQSGDSILTRKYDKLNPNYEG